MIVSKLFLRRFLGTGNRKKFGKPGKIDMGFPRKKFFGEKLKLKKEKKKM